MVAARNRFGSWSCVLAALIMVAGPVRGDDGERVSFSRDIGPILSDRCYQCHGPDSASRKADLRLDTEDGLYGERDGYRIIDPKSPDDSELILRITSDDESYVMPPADSTHSLSSAEVALIRKWVEQGAKWEKHWSFLPPVRPEPPAVPWSEWPNNSIDSFVAARLHAAGLHPSSDADKRTLIRRAFLDVIGLPPTPVEIAEFLNDTSPAAYENMIDRLLASPRFGERMSLPWLDASRYADSSGYQEDYGRYMYPWRTWVIDAINANMPFDEFVTEQMAGDLLPQATPEQVVATAYHRNHRINQEVGSIDEEFLVEYAVDRLETTSTMFLGLTIGCARCHKHKFDPISHEEFYQLYAFFNNNDELGIDQESRLGYCKPYISYPEPYQKAEFAELQARLAVVSEPSEHIESDPAFADWLNDFQESPPLSALNWHVMGPARKLGTPGEEAFEKLFGEDQKVDLDAKFNEFAWTEQPDLIDGHVNTLPESRLSTTYLYREVLAESPTELTLSIGVKGAIKVWVNGESVMTKNQEGTDPEPVTVTLREGPNTILLKLNSGIPHQEFSFEPEHYSFVPAATFVALAKSPQERSENELRELYEYYRSRNALAARSNLDAYRAAFPKVMVMQEREDVRPARVLTRGQYDMPGERVERDTPASLPPFPEDQPRNRLGLARWLTAPDHPLLARVTVNRIWQTYFGTGLVKTAEDFGAQGEWPSHPELLDWLAVEFQSSGWDVKHLHRLILTSATYRQSSATSAGLRERDPENRLLSRGPRFRLPGYFVRDQALYVSGLLVERIGGPSVKPYQPEGLWEEVSNLLLSRDFFNTNMFVQDHGEKLYRRSLYTFWKRSIPPPNMAVFDAGSREACTVRSQTTNTPMQAMSLLNGVTYVEAARHLAGRAMEESADSQQRLSYAMELVTGRLPTSREADILSQGLNRYLGYYRNHEEEALRLLSHGESPNWGNHDPATHAAYTQIALLLLNLDETITKQ